MSDITRWNSYDHISGLDPLDFDTYAADLPDINSQVDVASLAGQYGDMVGRATLLVQQEPVADMAVASLRDLDFVAGSLLRHGETEIAENDLAQSALAALSELAGTVPRGTVFTYAACNPDGERRRSFTGTDEECLFVDAVKEGIDGLDNCIGAIGAVAYGDSSQLSLAGSQMDRMVASIIAVKRGMTPMFFTTNMRPYFDPLTVHGTAYDGAGGAQMQVIAVDRMVWGADCDDEEYLDYYKTNVQYLTPDQRRDLAAFEDGTNGKSVVTLIKQHELPAEALLPTIGLLRILRKFRYPHRRVARENFALRPDDAKGSGSYTPDVLDRLIILNENAIAELEQVA